MRLRWFFFGSLFAYAVAAAAVLKGLRKTWNPRWW